MTTTRRWTALTIWTIYFQCMRLSSQLNGTGSSCCIWSIWLFSMHLFWTKHMAHKKCNPPLCRVILYVQYIIYMTTGWLGRGSCFDIVTLGTIRICRNHFVSFMVPQSSRIIPIVLQNQTELKKKISETSNLKLFTNQSKLDNLLAGHCRSYVRLSIAK